jgi:replicative DNA helicase Mcm
MIGNPKLGSFDNFEPISKQIGLPTPLISRFDLIFPIRDIPDKVKDETIADAILNKHIDIDDINEREIPLQILKNYICYVSLNIKPKLSDEARDEIKRFFLGVRSQSIQNGTIGIKHRHLEGLIRMAEASAKLHMRDEVTVWDARKAIELMTLSLTAFGLDKDTGIVDVDKIYTGISSSQRNKIGIIKKIIEAFDDGRRKKILVDEIIMNASNEGIDEDKTVEIITKLKRTGDIICVDKKHIQKI